MKEKLKISIITNTFPPEFGAASFRFFDIAKALLKAGHNINVLTGMPNYPLGKIKDEYKGFFFLKESINGIPIRRHWFYPSNNDKKWSRFFSMFTLSISLLFSLFHILKKKPDIIIVQYPPVFHLITVYFFSYLTGAKLILNVSDIWPSAIFDLNLIKRNFLYRSLSYFEKYLYRNANLCLGQSEEIVNHIQNITNTEVMLLRACVNCEIFQVKNYSKYSKKSKLTLVYAGVLGIAQNLASICKAIDFSEINTQLYIYGDGFEKSKIIAIIKNFPSKNIFYKGTISNTKIVNAISCCDAVLITQRTKIHGTLPAKIYEAMGLGMPILFSGSGEGAEIIKKCGCGLVSEPGNFESLKKNIIQMNDFDKEHIKNMGMNGRKLAEKSFNREKEIKKLLQKINSLSNLTEKK